MLVSSFFGSNQTRALKLLNLPCTAKPNSVLVKEISLCAGIRLCWADVGEAEAAASKVKTRPG